MYIYMYIYIYIYIYIYMYIYIYKYAYLCVYVCVCVFVYIYLFVNIYIEYMHLCGHMYRQLCMHLVYNIMLDTSLSNRFKLFYVPVHFTVPFCRFSQNQFPALPGEAARYRNLCLHHLRCSVLQCVAVCCSVFRRGGSFS